MGILGLYFQINYLRSDFREKKEDVIYENESPEIVSGIQLWPIELNQKKIGVGCAANLAFRIH